MYSILVSYISEFTFWVPPEKETKKAEILKPSKFQCSTTVK